MIASVGEEIVHLMGEQIIYTCNECGATSEDGHNRGCSLRGKSPLSMIKKEKEKNEAQG